MLLQARFTNPLAEALLQTLGSPTILCIIGSRMFFNLKEAAEHGINIGTNWSSYSHSAIRFDEPQSAEQQPQYVTCTILIGRLGRSRSCPRFLALFVLESCSRETVSTLDAGQS